MDYDTFRAKLPADYNPFTYHNPNILFFNHSIRCYANLFPYMHNHILISPIKEYEFPYQMSHYWITNYFYAIIDFSRYMLKELGDAYGIIRIKTDGKSVKQTHFHILPSLPTEIKDRVMFFNNVLPDIDLLSEMQSLTSGMIIVRIGKSGIKFLTYKNDIWFKVVREENPNLYTDFLKKIKNNPPRIRELKVKK